MGIEMRAKPLLIGENVGLFRPVTQLDCEVCEEGRFGQCRFFREISGLCICLKESGMRDDRILR